MLNLLLSILLLASTALHLPVFGALTAFSSSCAFRPEVATLLNIGYDVQKESNIAYDAFNRAQRRYDGHSMLLLSDKRSAAGSRSAFFDFTEFLAAKTGANLTKAELDKLYPRVTPRRGLADEVWERSKAPNGKVYDPSGVEIKPGDYWELGHTPGNKFSDAQRRAAEQGWDRSTWRQYQNDPDIYRPELRPTNRSHRHESDW